MGREEERRGSAVWVEERVPLHPRPTPKLAAPGLAPLGASLFGEHQGSRRTSGRAGGWSGEEGRGGEGGDRRGEGEPRLGGWVCEVRGLVPLSPVGCKELLIATKRDLGVGEGAVSRLSGATVSLSARVRPGQSALLM